MSFDPNAAAPADSGIFGLPYGPEESRLLYLPVPWEATTSYGGGTAGGPEAILAASRQVDLFDLEVERPYEAGLHLLAADSRFVAWNGEARPLAQQVIARGGAIGDDARLAAARDRVNALGAQVNDAVSRQIAAILDGDRVPGLIGGDHSTPFGAIRVAAERYPGIAVLQVDAHMDLREAYEGFTWSHASIMHNVVTAVPGVGRLVQVGIRDFCEAELDLARDQGDRVRVWFDADLARRRFKGGSWGHTASEIVADLPSDVWISFDIDGLDPRLCPHTGTPVPGGLDFNEAVYLIAAVARSGRRIVGFDLNEVAPGPEGEWDANVGARLLYKLTAWTLVSRGIRPELPRS
ncbi:MAG TPA: agmatinase family protein [Gemmatimonadales bacterium]